MPSQSYGGTQWVRLPLRCKHADGWRLATGSGYEEPPAMFSSAEHVPPSRVAHVLAEDQLLHRQGVHPIASVDELVPGVRVRQRSG
jgi:hypothetical protein